MYYGTHFCIKIDDFITNNVINYNIHVETFHKLTLTHTLKFRVMQVSL